MILTLYLKLSTTLLRGIGGGGSKWILLTFNFWTKIFFFTKHRKIDRHPVFFYIRMKSILEQILCDGYLLLRIILILYLKYI